MSDFGGEPLPPWVRMICYGAGFLMVAGSIAYFVWGAMRASEAADWPTAAGRVIAAGIDAQDDTDDEGETTTSYYPRVRYRYAVAGTDYVNDAIWLNAEKGYSDEYDAGDVLSEFREGAAVRVHYDPGDPGDSALLLEGPPWWIFVVTAMGLPWIAIGWFLGPRRKRRKKARDPLMGAPRPD